MCFSLAWRLQLCIWIVIVVALVSILRVVVPWLMSWAGMPAVIMQIVNIVIWAIVAILVLYIIFALLSCLFGNGMPLLPHSR